jgi:hypothetical protein
VQYELVTKTTPEEGVRYHARLLDDEGLNVMVSPAREAKHEAEHAIVVAMTSTHAPVYHITE